MTGRKGAGPVADWIPREEWIRTLPQVVVAACVTALDPDGRILLLRYGPGRPGGGVWWLPGGMLDHDEHPMEAGSRELREEIGIGLAGALPLIGVDYRNDVEGTGPVIDYFFGGGTLARDRPVELSPEHDRHAFVHPTELDGFPLAARAQTLIALRRALMSGTAVYLRDGLPL
ncbi:NUDIX hydrolase [Streptomyces sp. NPDC015171]|uniref:NUDIX hydrolase n=1 Tax=Streptomyces sp. NPDC015171 TaxID=3364945 RepID=UPI0036F6E356